MSKLYEKEKLIRDAMISQGVYSPDLELFISKFAAVLLKSDIADNSVLKLKKSYLKEISREGNEKQVAHPAFKVASDSDSMTLAYFREACLTPKTLSTSDKDEVDELINDVNKIDRDEQGE